MLWSHDGLVRLNLASRHARAGRLVDAEEEARVVAELLQRAPDASDLSPRQASFCPLEITS